MADIGSLTITQQLAGLIVGEPRNITAQHMRDIVLSIDTKINTGVAAEGDLKSDGTVSLTQDWNMGAFKITANRFESVIVSGTPPLIVASTDRVPNLNADMVDGVEAAALLRVNGSLTLTGNWAVGGFDITGINTLSGNGDGQSLGTSAAAWGTTWTRVIRPDVGQSLLIREATGAARMNFVSGGAIRIVNDVSFSFGNADEASMRWDTTQSNPHFILGVDSTTKIFLITDQTRIGTLDFTFSVRSQPTLMIHDGSGTLANTGFIFHDGTEFIIDNPKGAVNTVTLQSFGVDRLKASATGIEIFTDLLPNATNTRILGSGGLAWLIVFTRLLQPDTGSISIRNSSSAIRIEVNSTGIGFFATTPVAKAAALTTVDSAAIDATYGATEEGVLNNVRTRLNDLESRIQAYGLLT